MKRNLLLIATFITAGYVSAQTQSTVSMGTGYANENYYTLGNGNEVTVVRNNWDLAFAANSLGGTSSAIRINGAEGTELYKYSNNINDWTTLDTTGFVWSQNQLRDSDTSWTVGVFENQVLANGFDLGWGTYNSITHIVTGDRIFILKLANGSYKKLIINSLNGGVYSFQYANLDGTGLVNTSVAKSNYVGKNFGYYSVQNNLTLDREPASTTWDLLFTKYVADLGGGTFYPVTGVLANANVKVAQVNNVPDVITVSHLGQNFTSDIATMGYDWKTFNTTTFQYEIEDSLVYFVEDQGGDIYKIIFTGFGGSSTGDFIFTKEFVGTVGIDESLINKEILNVYPNPATDVVNVTFVSNDNVNQLAVIDISGKQVITEQLNVVSGLNQKRVDVSSLKKGIYFLTLTSSKSKTTQKLIIR